MALLANVAALVEKLYPLGVKLLDLIAKTYSDYKKGRQESQKLLFNVYREIKANLAVIDPLRPGALRPLAPNGPECKALAAGLSVKNLSVLYEKAAPFGKRFKGKETAFFPAVDKAVRFTENLLAITALPDAALKLRRKPRMELRIRHIKEQYLAVYSALFKK
jgi:hypothetical protein